MTWKSPHYPAGSILEIDQQMFSTGSARYTLGSEICSPLTRRPILMLSRICQFSAGLLLAWMLFVNLGDAAPKKVVGVRPGIRYLLKIEKEYIAAIDKDDTPIKKGAKVDVYLQSGDKLGEAEITEVLLGKPKYSLKSLSVVTNKGAKRKLSPNTILHIATDDIVFDVVQDKDTRTFVLLDLAKRDELAQKRLDKTGNSLWKEPTEEERKAAIDEANELFKNVRIQFGDQGFRQHETKFYMFLTDMPDEQVGGYIANLDDMYQQLCLAFGILPDKNIWLGKCPVVVFVEREQFIIFENTLMNNKSPERAQGLFHGDSNGKVVISAYRGNDPAFFGSVLVHETAHGFMHRLRSNVHIDSWLNEGVAEWIANVAVPASTAVPRRRSDGIAQLRTTHTLAGLFSNKANITSNEYGISSSMVDFMLQTDPNLFRAFLMAIKDGYTVKEALNLTFETDFDGLAQSYGTSIGVPNLTP